MNQPQPAPARQLPPDSQHLVNIMLGNLTANNAAPDALDAWREQRDAERAMAAAPPAPTGAYGQGPPAR